MTEVVYSDDENYANESFENDTDTDTDIPEVSDSDDASDYEPRVNKTSALYAYTRNQIIVSETLENKDLIRYTSASDDEDDVVISETIAEINTEPVDNVVEKELPTAIPVLAEEFSKVLNIAQTETQINAANSEIESDDNNKFETNYSSSHAINKDLCAEISETEVFLEHERQLSTNSIHLKKEKNINDTKSGQHLPTNVRNENLQIMTTEKIETRVSNHTDSGENPTMVEESEVNTMAEAETYSENDTSKLVCHITSNTPTSFNSDDYAFHMEFLKRNPSSNRIRATHRRSWSFTNERMREIERQNHILLKKILTQKPTYSNSTTKNIQPKLHAITPSTRITSAAVNRKKQQRQIDLDNQILWRKLQAISGRRPML